MSADSDLKQVITQDDKSGESLIDEDKQLVRRIDWRLLPWISVLYGLALVDRSNIGLARVAGMGTELKMSGNNSYSIALLAFFPGYMIFDLPSNLVIRRAGAANWLAFIITCWGAATLAMGFVHSWQMLALTRVFLGIFEAGFFPGCIYLISCWYKRYEVQTRLALFYMSSLLSSGFSGVLAFGLSQIHTPSLSGWRWIYIVEGVITMATAIVSWFFLVDFPQKAKFLNEKDRLRVIERLNEDRGDGEHDDITVEKILQYLSDWRIWCFGLMFCATVAPSYALSYFAPVILNDIGFSVALSQILKAPPYILAIIISLTTSYYADKTRHRTPFIFLHSAIAIVGFVLIAVPVSKEIKLLGIFLAVGGVQPNVPAVLAFAQNNIRSTSKRGVASAVQVAFGAIGGIAASTVFRDQDAPRYLPGLITTIAFELLIILIAGLMAFNFHKKNQQVDRDGGVLEGLEGFRYTT